ncbi:response regulator [Microcoleus sp. FACHB-831]|uniref:hybrid sensor histidine kinase/response regulator n=1 Tax=Microcoleus sp. FACHB-831 TaxID=2692827 RepID=UPI0016851113|nr:ATP-binding protein [Microcoleus sp. FACHB-831]MBD1920224.1 response regulator [Microcoleus sp. FACHB-831]
MKNANILVVEDESIVAKDIQSRLRKFGYYVPAIASTGEEAINKVAENHPDLVLMDIRIKGDMDGVEAAKEIHERFNVPIIYLTAYADANTLARAKVTQPFGYILKPFKERELQTTIEITLSRHEMERKLKENQQWLTTVLKSIGDAVITTDSNGKVTFMNTVAEALTGWQQADALGSAVTEVFNIALSERIITQVLNSGVSVGLEEQTALVSKNGVEIPIENQSAPIKDEQGNTKGVVFVFRDITKRLQAEEEREKLVQQLARLNTDLERQVQERTTQLQKSLGFEAVLKRIADKVRDSLDEKQILQTAVRELALSLNVGSCHASLYNLEQDTATVCYEHTTAMPSSDGRVLQMAEFPELYARLLQSQCFQFCPLASNPMGGQAAMLVCPMSDDRGLLGDLWLLHRTTYAFNNLEIRLVQQVANQCAIALRQARLYQAVQAQVEQLETLNRLKDDFLSTVSHELRTPVANMKMAIQMLKVAAGSPEKTQRYLEILQAECSRETELINDLLDLQRLEAASYPTFLAESINLLERLPKIIDPFRSRIQQRQQLLKVDIPNDLPPIISDSASLERVLAELLNNACKYTPAGEQIALTASAKEEKIQLQVSNSGVEIAASEMSRIFEKFYRIPRADRWKQGGTGLGLALVKKLAQHLGGTIEVDSGSNLTVFTVELPMKLPVH